MILAALVISLLGGLGWHYSTVLLRPVRIPPVPSDRVLAVGGDRVCLTRSVATAAPGRWGLRWAGGLATVGTPGSMEADWVWRPLLGGSVPPAGAEVVLDATPVDPDPGAVGLSFTEVGVPTPVGECPAWLVPAEGDVWAVVVHGRGADRRESLRILPTLHRLGLPSLVISYRNDLEAPPSADGRYHLGDTEWADVAAAAEYALARGARGLVLVGWSMGAALTAAYLDRAASAARVRAVVWDSPLVDWRATLRQQAALRRLPASLANLAALITSWRIGIDFDRFDLVRRPPAVRPPTLVFHGATDTAVPVGPTRRLAAGAAAVGWPLRYLEVAGAEHTAAWNVDPEIYERVVRDFLTEHTHRREKCCPE